MDRSADKTSTIIELYRAIFRMLQRAIRQDWLELDLSMAQLKTLFMIGQEGCISVGQVAELLGISLPTASQLIDKLVRAKLAERKVDETDRRYSWIQLTEQGQQLVNRLHHGSQAQLTSWLEQLSDEERGALLQGLQALAYVARTHEPSR